MTRYVPPTDGTFDVPIVRSEEAPATSNEDARLEKASVSPPIVYHLDPKDHDFVENYHKALLDKLASCGGKRSAGAVSRAAAQVQLHLEDGETAAGGTAGGSAAPPARHPQMSQIEQSSCPASPTVP